MSNSDLTSLRIEIDKIDEEIIKLLAKRFQITAQVGLFKVQKRLRAVDAGREAQQALRYDALARQYGLDSSLAQRVFRTIIDEVVANHQSLLAGESDD